MATSAANLCGVPVAIFHALIERESSWRPFVVSKSGARGLGQIKDSTLREVSPTLRPGVIWDGLVGSACYLRRQFDRFGTWPAALHAYRVGPSAKPSRAARRYAADIMEGSAQ
jgi:soluble lytic murein transglycosylase-like protein